MESYIFVFQSIQQTSGRHIWRILLSLPFLVRGLVNVAFSVQDHWQMVHLTRPSSFFSLEKDIIGDPGCPISFTLRLLGFLYRLLSHAWTNAAPVFYPGLWSRQQWLERGYSVVVGNQQLYVCIGGTDGGNFPPSQLLGPCLQLTILVIHISEVIWRDTTTRQARATGNVNDDGNWYYYLLVAIHCIHVFSRRHGCHSRITLAQPGVSLSDVSILKCCYRACF